MTIQNETIALLAITKSGASKAAIIAAELPEADIFISEKFSDLLKDVPNKVTAIALPAKDHIGTLFANYDQIVFLVALGGVVRLIAEHLKSKETDPGIIVVDNAAQFVIPVLSGHIGGANEFAIKLAEILDATPVVTTAADVGNTVAVDILGRDLGWKTEARDKSLTRVAAMMVNEEPVAMIQETGSQVNDWWKSTKPLPKNIHLFDTFNEVDLDKFAGILWVTQATIPESTWDKLTDRLIVYRPSNSKQDDQKMQKKGGMGFELIIGIGCDRGTPLATLQTALQLALKQINAQQTQIKAFATIDKKADETSINQLVKQMDKPIIHYSAHELAQVSVPNPSEVVMKYVGTPAVSEAAAILAANTTMQNLLVEKFKYRGDDGKNATISIVKSL